MPATTANTRSTVRIAVAQLLATFERGRVFGGAASPVISDRPVAHSRKRQRHSRSCSTRPDGSCEFLLADDGAGRRAACRAWCITRSTTREWTVAADAAERRSEAAGAAPPLDGGDARCGGRGRARRSRLFRRRTTRPSAATLLSAARKAWVAANANPVLHRAEVRWQFRAAAIMTTTDVSDETLLGGGRAVI